MLYLLPHLLLSTPRIYPVTLEPLCPFASEPDIILEDEICVVFLLFFFTSGPWTPVPAPVTCCEYLGVEESWTRVTFPLFL